MEDLQNQPEWLTKDNKVMERVFVSEFLQEHPFKYINEKFYDFDGPLESEDQVKKMIYDKLSEYVDFGIARKTNDILNVLKMESYSDPIPLQMDRIHFRNGTYWLDGIFKDEKEFCNNRLPVDYAADAEKPEKWLQFLGELLEAEDIPTLQEFMGYCLLPITRAQKMMMIIGRGGEGKSRIGCVMRAIFGDNMNTTSIQKVENDKFARADLEGKLVMLDDDMDMKALSKTNYIKSIVTSEGKMDIERKGIQSMQRQLYVHFICLGNGNLTSLHDRSDGFFRRQIVLTTKDKPADRVCDPFLAEKLIREKQGILLWMIEGLERLALNDFKFTISERAESNITNVIHDANNVLDFLKAEDYLSYGERQEATTSKLYSAYKDWCEDNAEPPISVKSFAMFLYQNASRYGLTYSNSVRGRDGKRQRGYIGVSVIPGRNPFL